MKTKTRGFGYYFRRLASNLEYIMESRCLLFCVAASPVVNLIIEILSRRSLFKGVACLFTSPLTFIYNSLIILVTLLAAALFKKRLFTILFICLLYTSRCV